MHHTYPSSNVKILFILVGLVFFVTSMNNATRDAVGKCMHPKPQVL